MGFGFLGVVFFGGVWGGGFCEGAENQIKSCSANK